MQTTDIFFLIVAPKRTGRESKVLEGPSTCRVWGRAEKTTEDNMNSYAAASIECVLAPWKFSFHFSHFLWIQSHSYHLFKLRVRSTVLYLIASGARNEKQRRLVSPHQRLRFPHFFFSRLFHLINYQQRPETLQCTPPEETNLVQKHQRSGGL